jgi:hypothetical protein
VNSDDNTVLVDAARIAHLGLWRAAVCVGPDGDETYWLLSPTPEDPPGCACSICAPHEQLGPVPTSTRENA